MSMTVVPTKIVATEKQASFLLQQKKALKQPMLPRLPKVPEQEGRQNVLLTICMIKKKRVNRLSSYEALRNTNYQTIFYQAVLY
ncbi:hypothetical protein [Acetivibrio thermocellus]|uniref:hypothetical protein n=1 Tax=Acetivibrio thermocellus TaxID=1515 RepID=UPI00190F4EFB|nr:hypothetical protein [Acetivibrio thermocellus]